MRSTVQKIISAIEIHVGDSKCKECGATDWIDDEGCLSCLCFQNAQVAELQYRGVP